MLIFISFITGALSLGAIEDKLQLSGEEDNRASVMLV